MPWLRRWPDEPGRTTLAAGLHAGSCAGITWALRSEVRAVAKDPHRLAVLAVGSAPAAVAGLLAADAVEQRLGRPEQVAALMAAASLLMAAADRRAQDHALDGPRLVSASLAQVAALVPGVSRGGATLTALRAGRVARGPAWQHSLLMSLPVTAGAAALTLVRSDRELRRRLLPALAVGAPAAAVTSCAAVSRVSSVRLDRVAAYRLGAAAVITGVRWRRRAR